MGAWFDDDERARLGVAFDAAVPGSTELGAVDYVERLLTALDHEPPQIWASPGDWSASTAPGWLELGPWERQAWNQRIEGMRASYRRVLDDAATDADRRLLHAHACEATYGDPAYGGNRSSGGWQRIAFPEPLFPPARETAG